MGVLRGVSQSLNREEMNSLTSRVLGVVFKVHTALGPGLLESAYESVLAYELDKEGLRVKRQLAMPLIYEEVKLESGYRIDLLVEEEIIIEVKSIEALNDVHLAQVMTYLRLSENRIGLLLNFNVKSMKDGIRRVVNNF